MAGARIRVASGNFVTARPIGVREGVDYCHTGEVRRIDVDGLKHWLATGAIALVPPIGYSPTGEVFNLIATDVARATAIALGADKWISLMEEEAGFTDLEGQPISNLIPREAEALLAQRNDLPEELRHHLEAAIIACRSGVKRIHLLRRSLDGALLRELFTRDGVGTLLTAEPYETIRTARIDDVAGILELLSPLEADGVLVRRSRELLETEIERFTVVERDGMVIGCASLYPYPTDAMAELAALAVHQDYRSGGRGDRLLQHMEQAAESQGIERLFVLTTRTAHWFRERGFDPMDIQSLPMAKQRLYNYRRNSKAFVKRLRPTQGST